jgi:hypothetical protein
MLSILSRQSIILFLLCASFAFSVIAGCVFYFLMIPLLPFFLIIQLYEMVSSL